LNPALFFATVASKLGIALSAEEVSLNGLHDLFTGALVGHGAGRPQQQEHASADMHARRATATGELPPDDAISPRDQGAMQAPVAFLASTSGSSPATSPAHAPADCYLD